VEDEARSSGKVEHAAAIATFEWLHLAGVAAATASLVWAAVAAPIV